MKQELENKRPDSEERRSIWQRWKQNLKDWVWFCKEHPDWLDLDVQTWVSTHIGQPLRRPVAASAGAAAPEPAAAAARRQSGSWASCCYSSGAVCPVWAPISGSGSPAAAREPSAQADGCRAFFEGVKLHPAVFVASCRGGDGRGGVPVHVYHRRHRPL